MGFWYRNAGTTADGLIAIRMGVKGNAFYLGRIFDARRESENGSNMVLSDGFHGCRSN